MVSLVLMPQNLKRMSQMRESGMTPFLCRLRFLSRSLPDVPSDQKKSVQKLKKGEKQLLRQAAEKSQRIQEVLKVTCNEVEDLMVKDEQRLLTDIVYGKHRPFMAEFNVGKMDETLSGDKVRRVAEALSLELGSSSQAEERPLMAEVYTDTEPLITEARRRGHSAMDPMSLKRGHDFSRARDRLEALERVRSDHGHPCRSWARRTTVSWRGCVQSAGRPASWWTLPWRWRWNKYEAVGIFVWRIPQGVGWQMRKKLRAGGERRLLPV